MNTLALALTLFAFSAPHHVKVIVPAKPFKLTLGKTRTIYTNSVASLAVSPIGDRVAVSFQSSPKIIIYNVLTGQKMLTYSAHLQPALGLAWSPDGQKIASGDERAQIYVWNAKTGHTYIGYRTHIRGIENLSFNPSSKLLVSTGEDDLITVYNLHKPKPVEKIYGHGANFYGGHFSPVSDAILTGTLTPNMRLYTDTGILAREYHEPQGQGELDSEFSPNGKEVVMAGRDGKAIVFNEATGKKIGTIWDGNNYLKMAVFSPDGRVIAVSSFSNTVKLYDAHTMKLLATIPNTSSVGSPVKFTSDGKFLITTDSFDRLTITPITPALAPKHR